jgi:hypothetical protein
MPFLTWQLHLALIPGFAEGQLQEIKDEFVKRLARRSEVQTTPHRSEATALMNEGRDNGALRGTGTVN